MFSFCISSLADPSQRSQSQERMWENSGGWTFQGLNHSVWHSPVRGHSLEENDDTSLSFSNPTLSASHSVRCDMKRSIHEGWWFGAITTMTSSGAHQAMPSSPFTLVFVALAGGTGAEGLPMGLLPWSPGTACVRFIYDFRKLWGSQGQDAVTQLLALFLHVALSSHLFPPLIPLCKAPDSLRRTEAIWITIHCVPSQGVLCWWNLPLIKGYNYCWAFGTAWRFLYYARGVYFKKKTLHSQSNKSYLSGRLPISGSIKHKTKLSALFPEPQLISRTLIKRQMQSLYRQI